MSKLTYTKTKEDSNRELRDLRFNQTVRFIKNQEAFKFNIGDIVIMQHKYGEGEWHTHTSSNATNAPTKYMYVFENEVGVGYIKRLKADGSGFTTVTTCTADLNPAETRLILDPDLVDHMLLSDKDEVFDYAKVHAERTIFRRNAIEKNKKLIKDLSTPELRVNWFHSLKIGDVIWMGHDWDSIVNNPQTVINIKETPLSGADSYDKKELTNTQEIKLVPNLRRITVKNKDGYDREHSLIGMRAYKVLNSKPWFLKESDGI